MNTIVVAKDFSLYPGGRTYLDGDFSAEEFKEKLLLPAIEKYEKTYIPCTIYLDGVRGYADSFLDEAFCWDTDIFTKCIFRTVNPHYVNFIVKYATGLTFKNVSNAVKCITSSYFNTKWAKDNERNIVAVDRNGATAMYRISDKDLIKENSSIIYYNEATSFETAIKYFSDILRSYTLDI